MPVPRDAISLAIFIGEEDCLEHQALYGAIVLKASEQPLAGASLLRGPLGFGPSSRRHTTELLRLSQDLPMVIEMVDRPEKIALFLPLLEGVMSGGPVSLEMLKVAHYGPGKPGPALAQELDMDIDINRIANGRDPPEEVNLIVEIAQRGAPVKYEFDTASGAWGLGRFCVDTGGGDRDLSPRLHGQIGHFFGGCKDLEEGEWIELVRWADAEEVKDLLPAAIARAEARATP